MAAEPADLSAPEEQDASAFRDSLSVLTDGKGHYLALVTFEGANDANSPGEHLFYGDGKRFYTLRSSGGSSSSSDRRFTRYFWEPRGQAQKSGVVRGDKDSYRVQCDKREIPLTALAPAERAAMLKSARFFAPLWKRYAYVLARDDEGNYYYVDRARHPPESFDFRLYRGQRGDMKEIPLVNIVSDSEGDIFASKRGRLRLILNQDRHERRKRWQWVDRKKRLDLVHVPVAQNTRLIYRDLGIYDGQRLGTPCDDL